MNFKKLIYLFFLILSLNVTHAVQVVESSEVPASASPSIISQILGVIIFGGLTLFVIILVFTWIIYQVNKFIQNHWEGKRDFLFSTFTKDLRKSHLNHNPEFKKRNWKLLWFFWKRKPVFIRTTAGKTKVIGMYEGEFSNKEDFFSLSIYNKTGIFAYTNRIIMIPMNIKDKVVDTIQIGKEKAYMLHCEGIDTIENVEYYLIPLLLDPENDKKTYIDFSRLVHKDYIEKITDADIIKNNLMAYKKNVEDAVETNLDVHLKRRSQ